MSDFGIIFVNGTQPADPLVFAGDGPTLIGNGDINTTLYIGQSNAIIAGKLDDTIPLTPQSWVVVDGKESIYGITNGPSIQVSIIPGGLAFFQSGISGGGFTANQYGAFFYNGVAGPGRLIVSITGTGAPGVDQYGNAYTPGSVCIGAANGTQIILKVVSPGQAGMQLPTHAAIESATNIANITADDSGSGVNEFLQMLISGPSLNVLGARDWTQIMFNSANAGNTSSASLTEVYIGSNGVPHFYKIMDITGYNISPGSIVAAHPGQQPAVPETWQTLALINGFTSGTNNGFVDVPQIRLMADNRTLMFKGSLTVPSSPTSNIFALLPANYPNANLGGCFGIGMVSNYSGGQLELLQVQNNANLTLRNALSHGGLTFNVTCVIPTQ
jgi:hypothetical protein